MERLQRTFGQYEIVARIGRGGMAEIFLAQAKGPGGFQKIVALKCVHAHLADDEAFRAMLLDEARVAAGLDHPAIVQTHALGEQDGTLYIAMEYVPGQPLHRLVRKLRQNGRRLVQKLALRVVIPIAEGLAFAHERRDLKGRPLCIVHRDVSPQNILIGYDGATKLTDFGIAKAEGRTLDTTGDAVKGKVAYMAPEQVHAESLDGRADVFALGIVLFELLTGTSPFRAQNEEPLATMRRIAEHDPPAPSLLAPELGPEIDKIVLKSLAKRRDQRYGSAREFAEVLERYAHTLGPSSTTELSVLMHDLFRQEIDELDAVLRGIDDPSRLTRMPTLGSRPDLPASTVLTLPDTAIARPTTKSGGAKPSVPPSTLPLAADVAAAAERPSSPDTIASHGQWVKYSHAPVPSRRGSFWLVLSLSAALLAGGVVLGLSGIAGGPAPVVAPASPSAEGRGPRPSTENRDPTPTPSSDPRAPTPSGDPRAPGTSSEVAGPTTSSEIPGPTTSGDLRDPSNVPRGPALRDGPRPPPGRPRGGSTPESPDASPDERDSPPVAPSPGGMGRLTLDAEPWANVYADGRLIGPTPLFEHRLPAGPVTLRLVNPGERIDKTVRLEIPRDGLLRRRISLRP